MKRVTKKINRFFESLGDFFYVHKYVSIITMLSIAFALGLQLPGLKVDTTIEGFLREDDPALIKFYEFRKQFGRDDAIIIALNPPDIFSLNFLNILKSLHYELEDNVPYLNEITSMINARFTIGRGDELIVEDLLEKWPEDETQLEILREKVFANPLYKNTLISEDGKFTTITIKIESFINDETDSGTSELQDFNDDLFEDELSEYITDAEETTSQSEINDQKIITSIKEIISDHRDLDFPVYLSGSPVINTELTEAMQRDMTLFMGLAILVISIFLYILFQSWHGVMLPLLVVILTLISTLGLMALSGTAIKLPSQIMPSFLLVVCVCDSVHILAIFYRSVMEGREKQKALREALGHSGTALLMTTVTTSGGLLSFANADIAPVADIGIFGPVGVLLAFIYTIVLLPPLLSIIPMKNSTPGEKAYNDKKGPGIIDGILTCFGNMAVNYPKTIIGVSLGLLCIAIASIPGLTLSHHPVLWLPENAEVRRATEIVDEKLKGTSTLEVILDTGEENGWYDPELLQDLNRMSAYAESYSEGNVFVGQAISLVDMLKEINQALHENRSDFYTIPEDRNLIAQEFLLFENSGSDDLEDLVDSQFSKSRFSLKLPTIDAVEYTGFTNIFEKRLINELNGTVEITITGIVALLLRTIHAMMISMIKSYTTALIVISILMIILLGRLGIGLLSMIPNLFPIILILGIMEWFHISLDAFTLLIGSIAIGLVVDDTIHFFNNFQFFYDREGDVRKAVVLTLQSTGRAVLFTSLVLSSGFFIYMFASLGNLFYFGLLTGITILLALCADLILAPALMVLYLEKR